METGSARQVFAKPRHPYKLGLLQSVPRLDATRKTALQPIEGAPRDMLFPPNACPVAPRCRYEVEQTRTQAEEWVAEVRRLPGARPAFRTARSICSSACAKASVAGWPRFVSGRGSGG